MKKIKALYLLPALFALASCGLANMDPPGGNGGPNPIDGADEHISDGGIDQNVDSGNETEIKVDTDDEEEVEIVDSESVTDLTVEGIAYDNVNKVYTITQAGEFVFKGEFNGNIVVNAGDEDEVKITLNGFSIVSKTDAPIKCVNAGELQVSIKSGSKNYIYDYREHKVEDNDEQGNGAITSACDCKISGKGSLNIVAQYNNGIHCKDDLKVKPEVKDDSSLQIYAYNNALKGNDSVTIESGNLVLISTAGNGILTENSDVSSKGNQKGNIDITGGHIDIYSFKDAIDAAYNVNISKTDGGEDPIINIYTNKYSEYSDGVDEVSNSKFYLRLSDYMNTTSYYYAVEFLTSDYYTSWVKATSASNSQSRYKTLVVDKPAKATSFKVCSFANNVTEMSEDNAYAKMKDFQTINTNYDTVKLTSSGTTISVNGWTNQSTNNQPGGQPGGGGPGQEGNTEKSEVSSKGIKAANIINISAGDFFIKTYDDAIHANYGDTLENSETGVGDVNISGGDFDIYASDDGLHADHALNISGGTIKIDYSYEGVEGNLINISGGYTKVYSVDDGLNAANKSGVSPAITISGGITDVTVYGQDVDGIDSNGKYTQTGGYVITKGGNSNMSTGLDCDGTATISGGTFVAFGRTEKTPTKGSGVTSYSLSGSYAIGSYKVTFADSTEVTVTTKYSYSVINVYSDTTTKITVTKN